MRWRKNLLGAENKHPLLFGSFFLHPLHFSSCTPQCCKFWNWPSSVIWNRNLGVCYGFIVNHVSFWMRRCSESKICINCWFLNCWIWKSNFYYGLEDAEWFFSIMNLWIQKVYFELRIGRMIFSIMDVLHHFLILD